MQWAQFIKCIEEFLLVLQPLDNGLGDEIAIRRYFFQISGRGYSTHGVIGLLLGYQFLLDKESHGRLNLLH